MEYAFTCEIDTNGAPVAELFGTARIEEMHGKMGQWHIAGIRLETTRGRIQSVELTDPWLYARVALHLLNARRADIDAAWREHLVRRVRPALAEAV